MTKVKKEVGAYICSECFGKLATFMLTNPSLLKQMGFPKPLTVNPLEAGMVEFCSECKTARATGTITRTPPPLLVTESGESE